MAMGDTARVDLPTPTHLSVPLEPALLAWLTAQGAAWGQSAAAHAAWVLTYWQQITTEGRPHLPPAVAAHTGPPAPIFTAAELGALKDLAAQYLEPHTPGRVLDFRFHLELGPDGDVHATPFVEIPADAPEPRSSPLEGNTGHLA
jgi:hypothetical protein